MTPSACQTISKSNWDYFPSSAVSNAVTAAVGTLVVSALPLHGVAVTALQCGVALITITVAGTALIAFNAKGHGKNPQIALKETRVTLLKTVKQTYQNISALSVRGQQIVNELNKKQPQANPTLEKVSACAKWFARETFYTVKGALQYSDECGGQKNAIYTGIGIAAAAQTFGSTLYSNIILSGLSAAFTGVLLSNSTGADNAQLKKTPKSGNELTFTEDLSSFAIDSSPSNRKEEGAGISSDTEENTEQRQPFDPELSSIAFLEFPSELGDSLDVLQKKKEEPEEEKI
jgi:hypothetical protein